MTHDHVLTLLEDHQNPRGLDHWERLHGDSGLRSFGIGLTVLRKLAKQIGRDHELALRLWASDVYDAKVIGLLIDEPKKVTREQAEEQVDELHTGLLAHVFASCDATLAKTSFAAELAEDWIRDDDIVRQSCGYGLLYEISKDKRKRAPDEAFFLRQLRHLRDTQLTAPDPVRRAMGGALIGVGKRSKTLNAAARVAALEMGRIEGHRGCDPVDVMKHLTSDYITKKLGLGEEPG